ncbi:GGDEF domain-containing protein [Marinobacter sediminum]|uniref:GGDEF domain-containing protein n=1 Tax=Marinobacter sediminum TaxID=256323 RepID=UPI001939A8FD|nr:GGDEF domain-containing protein [Marinobacter sediminum]
MELNIHLPTLLLLSVTINLMVGGLLWLVYRLRDRQTCFRLWALACVTFVAGSALAGARIVIDVPLVTVLAAHLCLGLSPWLVLAGIHNLLGMPLAGGGRSSRVLVACGVFYVTGLLVSHAGDALAPRVLTALWSALVFSVAIYRLASCARTPRLPFQILQTIFGIHGILMMLQVIVIGTSKWELVGLDVDAVLTLILAHHLMLATATVMALPLLAFTQAERNLKLLAERDELTQLLNRRAFFQQGIAAFEQARAQQHTLTVLMIDLDYFKEINDQWGHEVGDRVLSFVATIMTEELRDGDIIGRIGGEEFAAVLNIGTRKEVETVTERLLTKIAKRGYQVGGYPLPISASIGGVAMSAHTQSFQEMMRRADSAMYQAKDKGRNRVEFAPVSG